MKQTIQQVFELLKASLFTDAPLTLPDWQATFNEMKEQAVAALPGEWLKAHPISKSWRSYCSLQQGQWVRIMHAQSQLLVLLEAHHIPSVIIKGAAAAMYYPHPMLRSMGDVDVLVKREDHEKAAALLETNGYTLTADKDHAVHHYNYSKDNINIELHKRLPVIDDADETLLTFFEGGIDKRVWVTTEGNKFPVLPAILNGLVLIFHINQHLREGLGLRQIIDWMMYVNSLTTAQWNELVPLLHRMGMYKLAMTTTAMCQKFLGLNKFFLNGEEEFADKNLPVDDLMSFIMEKGNFGRKVGIEGKEAAFALSSTERGGFFRRLQAGGISRWKAGKKHQFLRPFAWLYQSFRILGILLKNHTTPKQILAQMKKGREQRELLTALGLSVDRTVRTTK